MSFDAHANLAYTLVAIAPAPAASGTSLTVLDGSVFPAAPFNATVWAINEFPLLTNAEIVRVTSVVGNVLTFSRQAEGSPNRSIVVGDQIAATITAKTLTDVEQTLSAPINVSAGTTSNNLSAVTFADSNGVSFGLNGSVITGTVATNYQSQGAYLTTAALSQDSSKYAGTQGAITGGSITVNTLGVSVNLPAYLTTAMQSGASTQFVQANAAFAGTNASGTIASSGISISVSAPGATASSWTVSDNQTSGTVGRLAFTNLNGVTLSLSTGANGSHTIVGSHNALTSQSTQYLAVTLGGNTAGTTSFNASDNASLFLHGGNNITLSGNGASITISGPNVGGAQTGISGIIVSDATYTSGTVSFSNAGNITIQSSVNGATQYIKLSGNAAQTTQSAIKAFGVSDTGNTAGNTGLSTGIDWVLAASNSLTLSQSTAVGGPNTVWMQVGAYLTTAMASGASTQFVQANAVFNGTNASGTIASNAISVSVAAPIPLATTGLSVASANSVGTVTRYAAEDHRHAGVGGIGISTSGNTAGTTGSVLGTYWLQGGNSITVSQITSNNGSHTLVISAGNYLTTAMASGDSTKFVQANAVFNGTNASGTIASNALSVSVVAPIPLATTVLSVASANSVGTVTRYAAEDHRHAGVGGIGISTSGNTAGTTGSVLGTYWLQGGNSITVSQITSNNGSHTLVISAGAYLTTAMASNRASDFVQATAVFNGTNATGTIASGALSVSVAAPIPLATTVLSVASANSVGTVTRYAAEDHRHAGVGGIGISTSGNTAGTTGSVLGTYWLQGGNSITVSQITSNNGSHTLVISAGAYLTTAMASNRGSDFVQATAVFNGTNASGTIASGALSVSVAAPIPIATTVASVASANSAGTVTRYAAEDHKHAGVGGVGISTSGGTAGTTGSVLGTYWFQGGNNVTVSQITSNNGSHTLVISGGNAAAAPVNFSAGTTSGNLGSVVFSNSNGISFGLNGSTITADGNFFEQVRLTGNKAGTETINATTDLQILWLAGGDNITLSGDGTVITINGAAGGGVNFSAGTTSSGLNSVVFSNSNGVSFGLNGSTITATVSTYSTVGTATTVYSVASANSVGTVTRWAAEDHRHAGVGGIGISTGNTSGTSGSQLGTYWLAGSNGVTLSQITSNNGSHTLVVSGDGATVQEYSPPWAKSGMATNSSLGNNSRYFMPFDVYNYVSGYRINFYISASHSLSNGNSTGTCAYGAGYALYTRDMTNGANSNTLSLLTSYAMTIASLSMTSNTAFRATHYIGLSNDSVSHSTSQYAVSNASVTDYISTTMCGLRPVAFPLNVLLTPGRYWLGFWISTTGAQGNVISNSVSVLCTSVGVIPAMRAWGQASTATNASFYYPEQGWGTHSQVGSTWPNSIPWTSDTIRGAPSQTLIHFKIAGYNTNMSQA